MRKYKFVSLLKKELVDFIELRKARGLRTTCKTALQVLDRYLFENQVADKALSYQVIDEWVSESYENLNPNTIANYISHYIQFAKYLATLGINAFIPIISYYKQTYSPYIFSEIEIKAIFEAADNLETPRRAHAYTAPLQIPMLLRILYGSGLRLNEALKLQIQDIDFEQSYLWIRSAKGNKDRIVPIDPSLHDVLVQYCDHLNEDNADKTFLFKGERSEHHIGGWALLWFRRILIDAGITMIVRSTDTPARRAGSSLNRRW